MELLKQQESAGQGSEEEGVLGVEGGRSLHTGIHQGSLVKEGWAVGYLCTEGDSVRLSTEQLLKTKS